MRWHFTIAALLAAWSCLSSVPASCEEISLEQFRLLQRELQPAKDEPWRTVPWKISLLDAQRVAARQKKPIFIWAMDGHPLGCT